MGVLIYEIIYRLLQKITNQGFESEIVGSICQYIFFAILCTL